MNQTEFAMAVMKVLESLPIPYMVVGSWGSGAWGEPRYTQDLDIVVDLTPASAKTLVNAFPEADFYVSMDAALEAIATGGQFNLIHGESGNKADFMVPKRDAWSRSQLQRRRRIELPQGLTTYVAAPEDIIISKMVYYRQGGSEKHLRDITGILKKRGDSVDRAYIAQWAGQLGLTEIWQAVLRRVDRTDK